MGKHRFFGTSRHIALYAWGMLMAMGFAAQANAQTINDFLRILTPQPRVYEPPVIRYYPSHPPPRYEPFPIQRQAAPTYSQLSRTQVWQLQKMLNDLGYHAGIIDGVAGRKTLDGLNAFRRDFGLNQSATLDMQSFNALTAAHQRSTNDDAMPLAQGNSAAANNNLPAAGYSPPPVAMARPSFDCTRASTSTELTICGNASLSGLDALLSDMYSGLLADASPAVAQQIKADQKRWIRQRNQCSANSACIQMAYSNRLAALQMAGATSNTTAQSANPTGGSMPPPGIAAGPVAGQAWNMAGSSLQGNTLPFAPTPMPGSAGATELAPDQVAVAAGGPEAGQTIPAQSEANDLRRLLHPPQDIKPVALRFFQGVPIMERPTSSHFFSLLMLRAIPDYFKYFECSLVQSLMAKPVVDQYVDGRSPSGSCWRGQDEFQRSDTRQAFYDRYFKALVNFAPAPPFRFAIIKQVNLQSHSAEKGGFPLYSSLKSIVTFDDFSRDLSGGRSEWALKISDQTIWPESIISMDGDTGRGFINMVASWPVYDQYTKQTKTGTRTISLVRILEVSGFDAEAKRIDIKTLSLAAYDTQLQQKVYDFPVDAAIDPFVRGTIPEKLDVKAPVEFDLIYALLRTLEYGDNPAREETWTQLADAVLQRDNTYHSNSKKQDALTGDNDSRRPFFASTLGQSQADTRGLLNPGNRAKLEQWAMAYKNGLPDEAQVTRHAGSGSSTKSGLRAYSAMSGLDASIPRSYFNVLESEGLQADQVTLWKPASQDFLIAVPNQQSLYTFEIEPSKIQPHVSHTLMQRTMFRTSSIKKVQGSDGKPAILIRLEPLSLTLESGLGTIMTHAFKQVPRLDDKGYASAGQEAVSAAPVTASSNALVLSPTLIDLIATRTEGDKLSEAAMAHIIARRWRYEKTEASPSGGRFFTIGKRQPKLDEIRPIIPQFIAWATQALPVVPQQVVIRAPIAFSSSDSKKMNWTNFRCFETSNEDRRPIYSAENQLGSYTSRRKRALEDGEFAWTSSDEKQLAALQALNEAAFLIQFLMGPCKAYDEKLGLSNPLTMYLRMDNSPPPPTIEHTSSRGKSTANLVFNLKGVRHANSSPGYTDLLPKALFDIYNKNLNSPNSQESIIFDAEPLEVIYFDDKGKEIERHQPQASSSLPEIIKRFHAALEKATPKPPEGPYGPDMIGLKLGMSFEEAEKTIRQHMKVGRVLEGQRNQDSATDAGKLRPLKSGKLFVSADERELIGILDEPPAVNGKVLVAWRRIYLPAGSISAAETTSALREKYGKPELSQDVQEGRKRNAWSTPAGRDCQRGYYYGQANALSVTWMDKGSMTDLKSADGKPMPDAGYPTPYFDPTNPSSEGYSECGPMLTAELNFDASRKLNTGIKTSAMDWIEMTLTDVGPYLKAYLQNRNDVHQAEHKEGANGESSASASGIKF